MGRKTDFRYSNGNALTYRESEFSNEDWDRKTLFDGENDLYTKD
jgi:hypothetical protein